MKKQGFVGFVYSLFIGLFLALFVGVGVAAFYEEPVAPSYSSAPDTEMTKEITDVYDADYTKYEEAMKVYNRNVMLICLGAATILMTTGLLVIGRRLPFAEDGFILGGLFTLVYSFIRGAISADRRIVFAALTVGIILTLYVGYKRFSESSRPARKS